MRGWLVLLVACGGGTDPDAPVVAEDPTPFGADGAVRTDVTLDLGDRGAFPGSVSARVHSPERDVGEAPLVVFQHGFGGRTDEYLELLDHIASWGFVVVAPQYDAGLTSARTHRELEEDLRGVIDVIEAEGLEGIAVDGSRLAVVGHSRGGKQSLHAAVTDGRIDVAIGLDPVDALPPFQDEPDLDWPSTVPELVGQIGGDVRVIGMGRGPEGTIPCAPAEEGFGAYADALPTGSEVVVLPTAGHSDLLDACAAGSGGACALCAEGDDPAATQTFVKAAVVAWLGELLDDDARLAAWWDGEGPASIIPDVVLPGAGDPPE